MEMSVLGSCEIAVAKDDSVRAVFDPGRLQGELEFHLPSALRSLADAIEAGDMSGRLAGFTPWGFQSYPGDTRVHLLVKLHLASEVRKSMDVQGLEKVG